MSLYSLIDTAKRIMLEDAGLSADPVAANNVKDGQVASLGVGPSGEPPGVSSAMRRRKHRRERELQRHTRRREQFKETRLYQDMSPAGTIDLADYNVNGEPLHERQATEEVELLRRFQKEVVDRHQAPLRKGDKARKKRRLMDGSSILLDPELPHDKLKEDLLAPLVSLGLGGYHDVISDIEGALADPHGREQVGELASRLFEVLRNDPEVFDRAKMLLREGA